MVALVAVAALPAVLAACSGSDDSAADAPKLTGAAATGQQLFRTSGCAACHSVSGKDGVGPALNGLAGGKVELEDGTTVTADEAYLRESITKPDAETVKGFRPVMPQRDLPAADVDALIAYLQAIGSNGK
ncbi:MAG: c-type cytochrome [Microthrixaceae bacterium]